MTAEIDVRSGSWKEILVPEETLTKRQHFHDPYTRAGAIAIVKRFLDDVLDMLAFMEAEQRRWNNGLKTSCFLSKSPLRSKIYVAAAMKTLSWVEEIPSPNGACSLVMTEAGQRQIQALKSRGVM